MIDHEQRDLPPELRGSNYVHLSVSDTGHGMDAATAERVFDPFFTTKPQVQGSCFDLYFPAVERPVPKMAAPAEVIPKGSGQRILFVDDEATLGKMARRLLQRLGYVADVETLPQAALATVQAKPHLYDLVITDLTMPDMLGTALAQRLLEIRPDLPVLMASGYSDLTQQNLHALGIRELLLKPFAVEGLAQAIHRALS